MHLPIRSSDRPTAPQYPIVTKNPRVYPILGRSRVANPQILKGRVSATAPDNVLASLFICSFFQKNLLPCAGFMEKVPSFLPCRVFDWPAPGFRLGDPAPAEYVPG